MVRIDLDTGRDFDLFAVHVDDHIEVCGSLGVSLPKVEMGGDFIDESLFFHRFHRS